MTHALGDRFIKPSQLQAVFAAPVVSRAATADGVGLFADVLAYTGFSIQEETIIPSHFTLRDLQAQQPVRVREMVEGAMR